jgi:hypothetical protein
MNKFDCQNLTKIASDLRNLKPRVDLALNAFEPADGVKAQVEASLIFKPIEPLLKLGLDSYRHLIEKVGSEEKLLKRISKIKLGGIAKDDLLEQLGIKDSDPYSWNTSIMKFAESDDFVLHQNQPEEFSIIRLTPKELGFDDGVGVLLKWVYGMARTLGLKLCPQDLGFYLALDPKLVKVDPSGVYAASEPIKDVHKKDHIVYAHPSSNGFTVYAAQFDDETMFDDDDVFYFCLPKHSRGKRNE